jgi:hypothetical protein
VVTNYHVVARPPEEPAPKTPPKTNPQPPKGPPGFPSPPGFPGIPNPAFPNPGAPNLPGVGFRGGNFGIGRPPGFGIIGAPGMGQPNLGFPGLGQPPVTTEPKKSKEPERPKMSITVVLRSGTPEEQSVAAELVAIDDDADLAALRITGVRNLPGALDVSQEAPLAEQMPVYVFGFPGGVRSVDVKKGTVSQIRKDGNNEVQDLQINGELIPGNSGGPIIDAKGRLVGIAVSTVLGKNVGFAVPTDQLNHMLNGSIRFGLVGLFSKQGNNVHVTAEVWVFDSTSRVRDHETIRVALGQSNEKFPTEFLAVGRLTDPMLRIRSATMHYATVAPGTVFKNDGQGWPALPNAQKVTLDLRDQSALGSFKPARGTLDDTYAFQFSYAKADGQTIYTQPHQFRLTFPKNQKTISLRIACPTDDVSRRYLEESLPKEFPGLTTKISRTADGLRMDIEPVDDPAAFAKSIKFGEVVSVRGWTISVQVKEVVLTAPTAQRVAQDLESLKDAKTRKAAAERLAKDYAPSPDQRVEVAKALESLLADGDNAVRAAAMHALKIWAGPENLPGIARLLGNDDGGIRGDIIAIVAKHKYAAAAPAIAKLLPNLAERGTASAALKAIGSGAQSAVIPYITHADTFTASEACHILKEIGTEESIPPLKAVVEAKTLFVGGAAKDAFNTLEARYPDWQSKVSKPPKKSDPGTIIGDPMKPPKDPLTEPKKPTPLDNNDAFVFCSDMKGSAVKNGPWPVTKHGKLGNPDNGPIVVSGEKCPEGISMHPPNSGSASVQFSVNGKGKGFLSRVSLSDTAKRPFDKGIFYVYGDGKELWKSGPIVKAGQIEECNIDINGIDVLELRTVTRGIHNELHMVWLDPRIRVDQNAAADLVPKPVDAKGWVYLSDLTEVDSKDGPWPISKNGKLGDKDREISVNGESSPKGIGMHPPNMGDARLVFSIEQKYTRFKGKVALNDGADGFFGPMTFEIFVDNKSVWRSKQLQKPGQVVEFDVDVTNGKTLKIQTATTTFCNGLHAVWLDPMLKPKTPAP